MKKSVAWLAVLAVVLLGSCAFLTQPVPTVLQRGPVVAADAKRLRELVETVAKPRDVENVAALDATAQFISDQLRAYGFEPEDQPYQVKGKTYRNVRLVIGDVNAPRLVVGAHYDSCQALPAADDNASGVAVVLELARLIQQHKLPGAVELVFWTLEEPPIYATEFMGSVIHANALAASQIPVIGVLSVETVGFYSDEEDSQHFPLPGLSSLYSSTGNYITLVSDVDNVPLVRAVKQAMQSTRGIAVHSINAPHLVQGIDWSDHRSYWPHGFRALMVTDTARNRNANYHEPTDTPDTLNYERMAAVTNALFEAMWVLTTR